jgi:hypothetical protein
MPKNLLDAVNVLLAARENDMLTSAEWDALLSAAVAANQAAGAAYTSFSVNVTYADGREPHRVTQRVCHANLHPIPETRHSVPLVLRSSSDRDLPRQLRL